MPTANPRFPEEQPPDRTISCPEIDEVLSHYLSDLGYRLLVIFPADRPRVAVVEKDGKQIRLEAEFVKEGSAFQAADELFVASNAFGEGVWREGRAGMLYRDLIPGRLEGKLIASHIKIPKGGPVPDYVHFHKVDFQIICCLRGWCELVYEDQGPAFRFEEGDCVLQPPGIRHRVLRCSDGFEVVELSSPAEHPTFAEHEIELPTSTLDPGRDFEGQLFVRHQARETEWERSSGGFERKGTQVGRSTKGILQVEFFRTAGGGTADLSSDLPQFVFVTSGSVKLAQVDGASQLLCEGDSVFAAAGKGPSQLQSEEPSEFILVSFPSFNDRKGSERHLGL